MNIQALDRIIPDVSRLYYDKLYAIDKEAEKRQSEGGAGPVKSLSIGLTATLVGAAAIVTGVASVPILAVSLAVGCASLGKVFYDYNFKPTLHDKREKLVESYRSGKFAESINSVSLWDKFKSAVKNGLLGENSKTLGNVTSTHSVNRYSGMGLGMPSLSGGLLSKMSQGPASTERVVALTANDQPETVVASNRTRPSPRP